MRSGLVMAIVIVGLVQCHEQYDARQKNTERRKEMAVGEDAFHRLKEGHVSPGEYMAVKNSPYVWGR